MRVSLPEDCGNSPRMALVSRFSVGWAEGDSAVMDEVLAPDAEWVLAGGGGAGGAGPSPRKPPFEVEAVEILSAINHGRAAACEGIIRSATVRIDFCHVFRFSGASKTAKIIGIRSYLTQEDAGVRPALSV